MNRCRIINGTLKRRFIDIPTMGATRPTSDKVKQALFNILFHRFYVDFHKTFVIDLFAGSGSLGIEAVSCGCKNALLIDSNKQVVSCIDNNLKNLKIENFAKTICQKAELISDNLLLNFSKRLDDIVIFMDPPYVDKDLLLSQISRFKDLFRERRLIISIESDEDVRDESFENFYITNHGNTFIKILSNY